MDPNLHAGRHLEKSPVNFALLQMRLSDYGWCYVSNEPKQSGFSRGEWLKASSVAEVQAATEWTMKWKMVCALSS